LFFSQDSEYFAYLYSRKIVIAIKRAIDTSGGRKNRDFIEKPVFTTI